MLADALEKKRYLKRRIDTLVNEARQIWYKIFEFEEMNQTRKQAFFEKQLKDLEDEISSCTEEHGRHDKHNSN